MFWSLLLLIGAVVAIVWIVRGRKPAAPPVAAYEQAPAATDWGRQPPPQAPQPGGMGGPVMGGLATGLALGAGALAAQEIGRHMLGGERSQQGLDGTGGAHHGGAAANSDLARDAGLGSVGAGDTASWDDGGGSFDGGDAGGDGGGGDA